MGPVRIHFVVIGRKPSNARLPGLDIVITGRYPGGKRIWRCCLNGLYSN